MTSFRCYECSADRPLELRALAPGAAVYVCADCASWFPVIEDIPDFCPEGSRVEYQIEIRRGEHYERFNDPLNPRLSHSPVGSSSVCFGWARAASPSVNAASLAQILDIAWSVCSASSTTPRLKASIMARTEPRTRRS